MNTTTGTAMNRWGLNFNKSSSTPSWFFGTNVDKIPSYLSSTPSWVLLHGCWSISISILPIINTFMIFLAWMLINFHPIYQVRMDISEIIMHPGYNPNTVDQDFALLRMANPVILLFVIFVQYGWSLILMNVHEFTSSSAPSLKSNVHFTIVHSWRSPIIRI